MTLTQTGFVIETLCFLCGIKWIFKCDFNKIQVPISHHGGPVSISGELVLDLW